MSITMTAQQCNWNDVVHNQKHTGFLDRFGIPIHEGDLVITRERHPFFRYVQFHYGHLMPWWLSVWWGGLGRKNGRAWLGVVVLEVERFNTARWIFKSINHEAVIHDYWANQLEVVQMPHVEVSRPPL